VGTVSTSVMCNEKSLRARRGLTEFKSTLILRASGFPEVDELSRRDCAKTVLPLSMPTAYSTNYPKRLSLYIYVSWIDVVGRQIESRSERRRYCKVSKLARWPRLEFPSPWETFTVSY
jgi:hypothetical protein